LFRAGSEGETVLSVLSRPIPPPSRFAGGVPRQLDEIVLRALSRDPEQRYSSARELVRALETFLAGAGDTVPTMDVADWVEGLFPGLAKRSDDLVELAHAVMPPERRQSARPTAPPVSQRMRGSDPQRAAPDRVPTTRPFARARGGGRSMVRLRGTILPALTMLTGAVAVFLGVRGVHHHGAPSVPPEPAQVAKVPTKPQAPVSTPSALVVGRDEPPKQVEIPTPVEREKTHAKDVPRRAAPALPAPTANAAGPERTGSVQLMTKNGRAEVYLDARLMGTTPLTLDLPVGRVALTLKPIAGGETRSVTVAIQAGAMSFITVPLAIPTTSTSTQTSPVEN
jgi:serine/threonine-protein kinase